MAKKKKSKKTKRVRIGHPLTPQNLKTLGCIKDKLPSKENIAPQKKWSATYRIINLSGYTPGKEKQAGFVNIQKHIQSIDGMFSIKVERFLRNETDRLHHLQQKIFCKNDLLSSPLECQLVSDFFDADGNKSNQICQQEKLNVIDNKLELRLGEDIYKKDKPGMLAINWGLFDAVQRLDFSKNLNLEFSMLEGIDILKQNQHLSYRGSFSFSSSENVPIHCFQQLGRAVMPTDYWLDENHRLLAVIKSGQAYVLDELMIEPLLELLQLAFDQGDFS